MNDVLIFLVLAAIALIFRWLTQQASGSADEIERDLPAEPGGPPNETDEERIRRFLEALGVPPGTAPPPPRVQPRPPAIRRVVAPKTPPAVPRQPKRSWVQPLPPLVTTPQERSPARPTIAPPQPVVAEVPPVPPSLVATSGKPRAPVRPGIITPAKVVPLVPAPRPARDRLFAGRLSLRDAVVLREILGPPRSLEPFEAHGL